MEYCPQTLLLALPQRSPLGSSRGLTRSSTALRNPRRPPARRTTTPAMCAWSARSRRDVYKRQLLYCCNSQPLQETELKFANKGGISMQQCSAPIETIVSHSKDLAARRSNGPSSAISYPNPIGKSGGCFNWTCISSYLSLATAILLWMALGIPHSHAQEFRASITGQVADRTGSVIPGASVLSLIHI